MADIKRAQQRLNDLSAQNIEGVEQPESIKVFKLTAPLKVDGFLGNKTTQAIEHFQVAMGIYPADKATGDLDAKTLAALYPNTYSGNNTRLKTVPAPVNADKQSLQERALQIALSQNGLRELTGNNDGEAVEMFLRIAGAYKGCSWCAAFVYWCVAYAARDKRVADTIIPRTAGVLDIWNRTSDKYKYDFTIHRDIHMDMVSNIVKPGTIFIMDFGRGLGHTGFVISLNRAKGTVTTIEGNTNSDGSRNGNGVYSRTRTISSIKGFINLSI